MRLVLGGGIDTAVTVLLTFEHTTRRSKNSDAMLAWTND